MVTFEEIPLQLAKHPGRRTCAGLRVTVRRDVHGLLSVWHGARCFGRYDSHGRSLSLDRPTNARAHVLQEQRSRPPLTRPIPPQAPSPPPTAHRLPGLTGQITCQNPADISLVSNRADGGAKWYG